MQLSIFNVPGLGLAIKIIHTTKLGFRHFWTKFSKNGYNAFEGPFWAQTCFLPSGHPQNLSSQYFELQGLPWTPDRPAISTFLVESSVRNIIFCARHIAILRCHDKMKNWVNDVKKTIACKKNKEIDFLPTYYQHFNLAPL